MDNTNLKNHVIENKETVNETVKDRVILFYNKNKKELLLLLALMIIFNFMCPSKPFNRIQLGGSDNSALQAISSGLQGAQMGSQMMEGAQEGAQGLKKEKGLIGKTFSKIKKTNVLTTGLSWMLSLVQSLLTFCGLILALAILPGLPVFIFMLILFFILRARVASIKSY
jgi:hypothetical protein